MASDESLKTSRPQFSPSIKQGYLKKKKNQGYQAKDSITSHLALPLYYSTETSYVSVLL